jgi:phosphonopyruvate decarboxylase
VGSTGLLPLLEAHQFDFFAGVPCSLIEALIRDLESHPRLSYVAAVREDVAVGMAAGAWFAGRRPVVLMQNSGLGTSLNALASLSLMYGLPALLVVTWRGYRRQDAPEHILMGEITPKLLDLLGIPHRVLSDASLPDDVAWAASEMEARHAPVALVVPPGLRPEGGSAPQRSSEGATYGRASGATAPSEASPSQDCAGNARARTLSMHDLPEVLVPKISRMAALEVVVKKLGREPAIHANGYMCRESFSLADRAENFYMIGSMGLASAIGLGLTMARPSPKTVVLDGDGNLLMNLGILPMVGALAPAGLVHCVFDNEVYGSTGNQSSPSRASRLDRVAAAAGYRRAVAVTDPAAIGTALDEMLENPGPHFLLMKVTADEAEVPRIPHTPHAIRDRFRRQVGAA